MKSKAFAEDSDDDDDIKLTNTRGAMNYLWNKMQNASNLKAQEEISKNLIEDPSIYDFDGFYEGGKRESIRNPEKNKLASNVISKAKLQPRYMDDIRKAISRKEIESSISFEKVAEKQIAREGGKTERFITQSYLEVQKRNDRFAKEIEKQEAFDKMHSASTKVTFFVIKGMGAIYNTMMNERNILGLNKEVKPSDRPDFDLNAIAQESKEEAEKEFIIPISPQPLIEESTLKPRRSRSRSIDKNLEITKQPTPPNSPSKSPLPRTKEELALEREKKQSEAKERYLQRKAVSSNPN